MREATCTANRSVRHAVERLRAQPRHNLERRPGKHARARCAADGSGDHSQRRADSRASVTACNSSRANAAAELVKLDHAEYGPATLLAVRSRDAAVRRRSDANRACGCRTATRLCACRKVSTSRLDGPLQRCGHGERRAQNVRRAVSSRSRAHRIRQASHQQFSAPRLPASPPTGRWNRSSIAPIARDSRKGRRSDKVICALSGGVDSAVAATLVSRAIGEQLTCIFVDHGLLRKNEAERVDRSVSRRHASERRCSRRARTLSGQTRAASRTRNRSASSSGTSSFACSKKKRRRFRASSTSCKARCIRTSSNRKRRKAKPATKSSRTTTSAAFRNR